MRRFLPLFAAVPVLLALGASPAAGQSLRMNLFVSSTPLPDGVTTGGPAADDHCALLGYAAGAGDVMWGAWMRGSTHPRERVGDGPWFNHRGVEVAATTDDLVGGSADLTPATALTEKGQGIDELPASALAEGTPLPDGRVLCVALR